MRYGHGIWGWDRKMGMGYEDGVRRWVWGEYGDRARDGDVDVIDIEMGLVWG